MRRWTSIINLIIAVPLNACRFSRQTRETKSGIGCYEMIELVLAESSAVEGIDEFFVATGFGHDFK